MSGSESIPVIPGVEGLQQVGRGGFGVVYRGRQPDLDRDVAVKVVLSSAQGADVERWRKEISAMGRLSNHPNILGVYSGGLTDQGLPYLVMPYVPGGSLQDRLDTEGRLAPAEVASIGAKLAGALAAAHEVGVLHRDVKPENVLLSPYGEPQLTDFGIARLLDTTTTVAGTVHATVRYAAPEVLSGQPATEAADVYGLGATLFACLSGAAPFADTREQSMVALIGRIATDEPGDLRRHGVPDDLAAVIEGALAKTPAERIGSADELRRRLEAAEAPAGPATRVAATLPETQPVRPRHEATDAVPVVPIAPDPGETQAAPEAEWTPPPENRRRPAASEGSRRSYGLLVALAVLVAGLAALLFVVTRDDSGERLATRDDQLTTEPGATEDAPATTDAARDTTTSAAVDASPIGQRALDYFEAIAAGDLKASYDMLSPQFQSRQSRGSYERFWRSVAPVRIVGDVTVDQANLAAVVPLTMAGERNDFRLTFIQGDDGTWYVHGPQPG